MSDPNAKGVAGVSGGSGSLPPSDEMMWAEVLTSLRENKVPPLHILRQLRAALYNENRDNKRSLPIALKLVEVKDTRGNTVTYEKEAWELLQKWMTALSINEDEIARRAGQKNQSLPKDDLSSDEAAVPYYIPPEKYKEVEYHSGGVANTPAPSDSSGQGVDPLKGFLRQVVRVGGGGQRGGSSTPATPGGGGTPPASPGSGSKASASALTELERIGSFFKTLISYFTGFYVTPTAKQEAAAIEFEDLSETSRANHLQGVSSTYKRAAVSTYQTSSTFSRRFNSIFSSQRLWTSMKTTYGTPPIIPKTMWR
jgi:hypothetical protein